MEVGQITSMGEIFSPFALGKALGRVQIQECSVDRAVFELVTLVVGVTHVTAVITVWTVRGLRFCNTPSRSVLLFVWFLVHLGFPLLILHTWCVNSKSCGDLSKIS